MLSETTIENSKLYPVALEGRYLSVDQRVYLLSPFHFYLSLSHFLYVRVFGERGEGKLSFGSKTESF